jgi:hypothetical protein
MASWNSANIKYSKDEKDIAKIIDTVLGVKYKGIGDDLATNLNLYRFLINNMNIPDNELAKTIKYNNKVIFTENDIADIKIKLRRHLVNYSYPTHILNNKTNQSGGVFVPQEQHLPQQQYVQQQPYINQHIDFSRNGFWDRLFTKFGNILTPLTGSGEKFLWIFFILYTLEQTEIIGPFISQGLDMITLSLPVIAEMAEDLASFLIPIPVANQMGGWVIGMFFLITSVFLNFSRKHFGSAFKSALEMLPIVGDAAALAAINIEQGMERFLAYKNKLVRSTTRISPRIGGIVQDYYPQLNNIPNPPEQPLPKELTGQYWDEQSKLVGKQIQESTEQLQEKMESLPGYLQQESKKLQQGFQEGIQEVQEEWQDIRKQSELQHPEQMKDKELQMQHLEQENRKTQSQLVTSPNIPNTHALPLPSKQTSSSSNVVIPKQVGGTRRSRKNKK